VATFTEHSGSPAVVPGWYPDPGGRHQLRWWDGSRWALGVADGAVVGEDLLPAYPALPAGGPPVDARALLPLRAAAIGLVALVLATFVGSFLAFLITGGEHRHLLPALLVGQGTLWGGMAGACWWASHRYGTGSVRTDLGMSARWVDLGWGFLAALGGRFAAGIVVAILLVLDRRLVGSNTDVFDQLRDDRAAFLALAVLAAVGAPLFEELFFRGLLLRSLQPRLGSAGAVAVQALLFGLVHSQPTDGWRNVSIILSTGLLGVLLGVLAQHFRRLGPGMATHFFFNLVAVIALLLV